MKNFLTQNSKIAAMSGIKTFNWGIPAFMSKTGFRTCPFAGICAKGCYARQGFYVMPNVSKAQEDRLALSLSDTFVSTIDAEIKRRKIKRVRLHDSGDFYSKEYLAKWIKIVTLNPNTQFYAYTKSIPFFSGLSLPSNLEIIFSTGGKLDSKISDSDKHSVVFPTKSALKKAGYKDASSDDSVAANPKNKKIGLVYHGYASKAWTTESRGVQSCA